MKIKIISIPTNNRNAAKWHHGDGGYLYPKGGYIPYDNSKGFLYYGNETPNTYDADYLNWLNNRDWQGTDKEVFDRLSNIYKQYTGKTLTPEQATKLGQDKKFGPFHQAYATEFNRYIDNSEPTEIIDNVPVPSLPVWLSNEQVPLQIQDPITYRYEVPISEEEETPNEYFENKFGTDWILPVISGTNVLTDTLGITNYANYNNADILARSVLTPRYIGYNPVTRHQEYNPVDRNFLTNRMINNQRATDNLLINLSGGNNAMASALLTNANYNNQSQLGEAILKAAEQDLAARNAKINYDNQADLADAQNELTAARANQEVYQDYARNYLTSMANYARMREDIDNQVSANRSTNWNNFLENMQAYFDNQRNRNMANSAYQGTGYWIDRRGTIHYTTKNLSNKTKKEAEKKALEIKNKKGE